MRYNSFLICLILSLVLEFKAKDVELLNRLPRSENLNLDCQDDQDSQMPPDYNDALSFDGDTNQDSDPEMMQNDDENNNQMSDMQPPSGGRMAPIGSRGCSNKAPRCNCRGSHCPHCNNNNKLAKMNDLRKKFKKPRLPNRQMANAIKSRTNDNRNNQNPFRLTNKKLNRNGLNNRMSTMNRANGFNRNNNNYVNSFKAPANTKTFASRNGGYYRNRPNYNRMRPAGNYYRGAGAMRGAGGVCVGGR